MLLEVNTNRWVMFEPKWLRIRGAPDAIAVGWEPIMGLVFSGAGPFVRRRVRVSLLAYSPAASDSGSREKQRMWRVAGARTIGDSKERATRVGCAYLGGTEHMVTGKVV
jgi:hypothetical protein